MKRLLWFTAGILLAGSFVASAQESSSKTESWPTTTSRPQKSRKDSAELRANSGVKSNTNNPVEAEYEILLDEDDQAHEEVDKWIRDNDAFLEKGAGVPRAELNHRIKERFEPVRKGYEDFLKRHPNHVKARIAYGSFLGDLNDEDGEQEQLEKALAVDTNNPAIYNNLANINGHNGDVKKAFAYYEKAIQLNPLEPVYYHNFGTTVFLFRKDAREYFNINEQQVFDKALKLYSNAMRLDSTNFPLACDIATTYYGIQPPRTEEALKAWTNALALAHDEVEREGVYIHLARVKLHSGRLDEARGHLAAITNSVYATLKSKLLKNIEDMQHPATNAVAAGTNASGVK